MIRLIACDLDETLLDDKKRIPQYNLEKIKEAKDQGVLFVPASGRGYTSMDSVLTSLAAYDKEQEYTISNNGGIVVENKGFRHISFHSFTFEQAKALFAYGIQKDICIEVFTDHDVYAFHLNEDERGWLFMFKKDAQVCQENSIDFFKDEPIVKLLFEDTDMERLYTIAEDMKHVSDGVASVSFSSNRYIELNPLGIDKGVGLCELCAYLDIPMEETMAIGDNDNDRELLLAAGVSVAVANANERIKRIADHVTRFDHNEGAVGEAIERFVLGKEC